MNTHRIHRVAKLTCLSKDVIRVWERRFGLLKPVRGANRYRNYSDEDVALLRFLKEQLDAGGSIGELSKLGREELLGRARASAPQVSLCDGITNLFLQKLLLPDRLWIDINRNPNCHGTGISLLAKEAYALTHSPQHRPHLSILANHGS